jgi:integrase
MAGRPTRRKRHRGSVEELPSGKFRVRVYSGVDPLTGREHYLREIVDTPAEAERTRVRLLNQVDERRQTRTTATLAQLLDRWLEVVELDLTTRAGYLGKIEKHIRPTLGHLPIAKIDAELLEHFYARLRRCRAQCSGRPVRGHTCQPLAPSTVRQIHWILSGALGRAVRWRWIAVNPATQAEPPGLTPPNPELPSAKDAARILTAAWEKDPDWGSFLWLAMTTGARRGELCALQWQHVDVEVGVLTIATAVAQVGGTRAIKGTKTHQKRRIALDAETVAVLQELRDRAVERAAAIHFELPDTAYVFSLDPDGQRALVPDTATQRYGRLVRRLGLTGHLHQLRHYSATELINAGVDVRTVAGRLGHGGGGATTLRVYAAWVAESDQRAATALGSRLQRPSPSEAKSTKKGAGESAKQGES